VKTKFNIISKVAILRACASIIFNIISITILHYSLYTYIKHYVYVYEITLSLSFYFRSTHIPHEYKVPIVYHNASRDQNLKI